jgi:hypothetical protein
MNYIPSYLYKSEDLRLNLNEREHTRIRLEFANQLKIDDKLLCRKKDSSF